MKFLSIAQMTFLESIRQPIGLLCILILSVLNFFAPAFSNFALGEDSTLLRTNLLSTLLMGGVVYISFISTSLFYKEIKKGEVLAILSKPVPFFVYYSGKYTGIILSFTMFFIIITSVAWMSLIVGTSSANANTLPIYLYLGIVFLLTVTAFILNYVSNMNIISFVFLGICASLPVIFFITYLLSPVYHLALPLNLNVVEFLKVSILVYFLLIAICSFSVSLSSFTGPVMNFVLSFLFLLSGLMSPSLKEAVELGSLSYFLLNLFPNFHVFWLAEMITLNRVIPGEYILQTALYTSVLSFSFSAVGISVLLRKDYS